eukprot:1296391-Karenia_brevis.AAC.1
MVREQLGTPNIHAFNAVLKKGMELMTDHPTFKKEIDNIKKSAEKWVEQPAAMAYLHACVPHFKVAKMFQGDWRD